MEVIYLLPPILGAFIGYITNVVAVKLLFHPKKPIKILGIRFQGLIPARSEELTERILDSLNDILNEKDFEFIIDGAMKRSYENSIKARIDEILDRFGVFKGLAERYNLSLNISSSINNYIANAIKEFSKKLAENVDIREFIIKKAKEISDEEIETLFNKIAKKELRFIEISGAVLGFIIGLIQSVILYAYI
ncbi:DUF445 domain-containing protein [Archaeoglobales archaeon]|nr:MAG: DUF445 domain-containing protein [Archaeoglobales archaeon]